MANPYDQMQGMTFTIFEDPITEQRSEGTAEVISVHTVTPLDMDYDLVHCRVVFLSHDRDDRPRYRTIKVCKPTEPEQPKFEATCGLCGRVLDIDDLFCWCQENTLTDHGDQVYHVGHGVAS